MDLSLSVRLLLDSLLQLNIFSTSKLGGQPAVTALARQVEAQLSRAAPPPHTSFSEVLGALLTACSGAQALALSPWLGQMEHTLAAQAAPVPMPVAVRSQLVFFQVLCRGLDWGLFRSGWRSHRALRAGVAFCPCMTE